MYLKNGGLVIKNTNENDIEIIYDWWNNDGSKNKINRITITLLVIIDQIIKLIVKEYYGIKIPIMEDILYFMPTQNTDYSWVNSLFELGLGRVFHIILVEIVLIFGYYVFKYLQYKIDEHLWINILKIFFMSGAICSLIDKIFWNGSLDYVLLDGLFIFDLKDCYLYVFTVIISILLLKNWRVMSIIQGKDIIMDYISFLKDYNKYV